VSTGKGVDRLDPTSGRIRHYTAASGLAAPWALGKVVAVKVHHLVPCSPRSPSQTPPSSRHRHKIPRFARSWELEPKTRSTNGTRPLEPAGRPVAPNVEDIEWYDVPRPASGSLGKRILRECELVFRGLCTKCPPWHASRRCGRRVDTDEWRVIERGSIFYYPKRGRLRPIQLGAKPVSRNEVPVLVRRSRTHGGRGSEECRLVAGSPEPKGVDL
jgi:hypothetical protein